MLRKSIIMMALAAAFTMNVSAVQIEVPKWQPPVPGADASIPANAYENYSHINEISEVKPESQIIGEAPIQAASVWNNGVPSFLVDNYQPGKKSLMYRFLRDDKNIYIMSLVYADGAAPYSHIQLRNTVEYSDFANIKTLRNKVIRIKSQERM